MELWISLLYKEIVSHNTKFRIVDGRLEYDQSVQWRKVWEKYQFLGKYVVNK
jgi:hypothetical protein